MLVDVNEAGLQQTAKDTGMPGAVSKCIASTYTVFVGLPAENFLIKKLDISDDSAVEDLFAAIEAKFGRLAYAVYASPETYRSHT